MSERESLVAARLDRARWTWRGNRHLVHASRRRSAWLAVRALFQDPPKADNHERSESRPIKPALPTYQDGPRGGEQRRS